MKHQSHNLLLNLLYTAAIKIANSYVPFVICLSVVEACYEADEGRTGLDALFVPVDAADH